MTKQELSLPRLELPHEFPGLKTLILGAAGSKDPLTLGLRFRPPRSVINERSPVLEQLGGTLGIYASTYNPELGLLTLSKNATNIHGVPYPEEEEAPLRLTLPEAYQPANLTMMHDDTELTEGRMKGTYTAIGRGIIELHFTLPTIEP